jgi:chaperonin GroES
MSQLGNLELEKIVIVGDRVLLKPKAQNEKTSSGLFLPPGVTEKEKVYTGYVIKVGPGYPIPALVDYDEPWKDKSDQIKYIPLQPQEGDLAVYLQKNCYEIVINKEKYVIVHHSDILLLYRDKNLFK